MVHRTMNVTAAIHAVLLAGIRLEARRVSVKSSEMINGVSGVARADTLRLH